MKVLETIYRGVNFRSRLEARWAVFFSELSIPFIYEPEGFEFKDGTRYLPDFFLPKQDFYVEIKPVEPSTFEGKKCQFLAEGSNKKVFLFYGDFINGIEAEVFFPDGMWDSRYSWCLCISCGQFGVEFEARAHRMPCKKNGCQKFEEGKEGRDVRFYSIFTYAYSCAQNERFGT